MSNYTKTTNFAAKDALATGNANKIVRGTEIDAEYNNIAVAVNSKSNTAGPTFTGTVTAATVTVSGTLTAGIITGGAY
jgi:predicted P-loop ATPase/GTPase